MNYIKLQKQLRAKHILTGGERIDRIFKKVNAKAAAQRVEPERVPYIRCVADYQYLCE